MTFDVSRAKCKVFKIEVPKFSVISFNYKISAPQAFNGAISFYKDVGHIEDLAATLISDLFGNFSKEFAQGTYYICFESKINPISKIELVAEFKNYQPYQNFSINFSDGVTLRGNIPNIPNIRPPSPCSRPLFFKIVDGSLPPGFRMTSLGRVIGIAPELDCMEDNASLPPSQNWSFANFDGKITCWGRQWRFKVEVSIQGMKDVVAQEWFCVRIHNDWDKDRDAFLAQAPFQIHTDIPAQYAKPSITDLCPTTPEPAFRPQPILQPCGNCNNTSLITNFTTIPPQLTLPDPLYFKQWLKMIEKNTCPEVLNFTRNLFKNPLIKEYLSGTPLTITLDKDVMKFELATTDPLSLYKKWHTEQTELLPQYAEVQHGENLTAILS